MAVEVYANQPSTTVTSGGTDAPASGTPETWTVASSASFPAASSTGSPPTQFHVADTASGRGTETIAVTNVSGTTWTVTRGAEGTTPVAHNSGFTITQVVTAGALGSLLASANNLSDVDSTSTALTNLGAAPLVSPALTGSPTAPTQTTGDTSTKIATDAFVATAAGAVQVVTATVSPIGTAQGTSLPNNGADFGPDTSGTTTSGVQEALTSIASTGGKVVLRQGAFQINSAMTLTTDYSVTIEGETRGRAENVTSSTSAWGVFLMVNNLASGTVALTINTSTLNLGMLQLFNFTVRGQALGYTGSSIAGMKFLATGPNGPAQIEIDNVACEYLAAPCVNISNSQNGPVIIGWIGFFYCGNFEYDTPMLQLTTGTCHIGHIEAFVGGTPPVGVTGPSGNFCFIDIDSIFSDERVFNFGCNSTAPSTYLHIGSVGLHNPGGSGLIRLEASAGSLSAHIGKVSWGNGSSQGYIVEGTTKSTSGTVQVTIESLWGNPQYLQWNNSGATVGTGSFLDILSAYFTVAPTADIPFANMAESVRTAASSWTGITVQSETSTTYTFALADAGTEIDYNSSSAGTFTIPPNSTVAFPVGTVISCRQIGTGQLTVSAGAGVTLVFANAAVTRAQYSLISVTQISANTWCVDGDT